MAGVQQEDGRKKEKAKQPTFGIFHSTGKQRKTDKVGYAGRVTMKPMGAALGKKSLLTKKKAVSAYFSFPNAACAAF